MQGAPLLLHLVFAFRGDSMPVDKQKTVRTSVIVPAELYRRVQQLAASNDVSAAWVVRHALTEFLAGHERQEAMPLRLRRDANLQQGKGRNKKGG